MAKLSSKIFVRPNKAPCMRATFWRRPGLLFLLAAVATLPHWGGEYATLIACRIIIYGMLALSLDLILGYGGLISLGHAAFFGVGAYTVGALVGLGINSGPIHIISAVALSAAIAFLMALVAVRARGIYFVMLTFSFAQMFLYLAMGATIFGGEDGMRLSHRSNFGAAVDLADPVIFYYVALIILAVVLIVFRRIAISRFGVILVAIRQNEVRSRTLGVSAYWYQVAAFAISGGVAGLAGMLMANFNAYVSPSLLDWKVSATLILMIVLGGIGTLYGAILGAAFYIGVEVLISHYTTHWMAIFGPLLVLAALFLKKGIFEILGLSRRPT